MAEKTVTENDDFDSPIQSQLAAPPVSSDSDNQALPNREAGPSQLLHNRTAVLAMLFLVTGVLGVPLLWMNPNFSTTERILWAIVVTIYTAILIFIAGAIVMWSYRQIFG